MNADADKTSMAFADKRIETDEDNYGGPKGMKAVITPSANHHQPEGGFDQNDSLPDSEMSAVD